MGSVVLGFVLSRVILRLMARIDDVATAVTLQFCGTFAVWILAEAAASLRHPDDGRVRDGGLPARRGATPARLRIPSYAVWEFAVFVLNVLAFILVGFQLQGDRRPARRRERSSTTSRSRRPCARATILARLALGFGRGGREPLVRGRRARRRRRAANRRVLSGRSAAVVGWCGMRGIVTLAAALGLPTGGTGPAFPHRDLMLFTAFAVVLGTLVVQGMTLRPLMNALRLEDDGTVDREVRLARVETLRAALAVTGPPRATPCRICCDGGTR